MYCQQCGRQIKDNVKHCTYCGAPQEVDFVNPELSINAGIQEHDTHSKRWVKPVVSFMIVAILGCAGFATWHFGLLDRVSIPSTVSEVLQEVPVIGNLIFGESPKPTDQTDDGESPKPTDQTNDGESPKPTDPTSDGKLPIVTVPVKETLDDYTWAELSDIAKEISAAQDKDAAFDVAVRYHLMNDDATYSLNTKTIELVNGNTYAVQVVGIYHDQKSDGQGMAGLSFLFTECVDNRCINSNDSNYGGWESCELRAWLNSDFYGMLPSDLHDRVVSVDKRTNNTGLTSSLDSISITSDKVWLPSVSELLGESHFMPEDEAYKSEKEAILGAEGSQYGFFSANGVSGSRAMSELLQKRCNGVGAHWWLRSPSPGRDYLFRSVKVNGDATYYGDADDVRGVVPGFCL